MVGLFFLFMKYGEDDLHDEVDHFRQIYWKNSSEAWLYGCNIKLREASHGKIYYSHDVLNFSWNFEILVILFPSCRLMHNRVSELC